MLTPNRSDRVRSARLGRLCAEAIRDRASRLALTLTLLAVWSGSALLVYITERDAAQASAAYTSSMLGDGYATLLIGQSDSAPEKLTWANCSTMGNRSDVRAVVGLREPVMLRLWNASGPEMAVREAMGEVAGFLAMTSPSGIERWSSPSLIFDVDALGARPADGTAAEFVTGVVQGSGDSDTRRATTEDLASFGGGFSGNAIMLAPPGGEISTCIVLTDLERRNRVEAVASALFPVGAGFGQQWALANADRFDSPRYRYEHRASRWYWLGAVAVIALTWALSLWILRSDLAVYSVAGLGTRQIVILESAEMLVVVLGAVLVTAGVAAFDMYSHAEAKEFVAVGLREVARAAAAGSGVCVLVAAATASTISRRTVDALKDR